MQQRFQAPPSIFIKTPASKPNEFAPGKEDPSGEWTFISKDERDGPLCKASNRIPTISAESKIDLDFDLDFEQTDGPVVTSTGGQRFAVPTLWRWSEGGHGSPEQLNARVFGFGVAGLLLQLNVLRKDNPGTSTFLASNGDILFVRGGLALSPNGGLLASSPERASKSIKCPTLQLQASALPSATIGPKRQIGSHCPCKQPRPPQPPSPAHPRS